MNRKKMIQRLKEKRRNGNSNLGEIILKKKDFEERKNL